VTTTRRQRLHILLVDDDHADVLLTESAAVLSDDPVRLRFARDGLDALNHLQRSGLRLPDSIRSGSA